MHNTALKTFQILEYLDLSEIIPKFDNFSYSLFYLN